MAKKSKYLIANWKMNKDEKESLEFYKQLAKKTKTRSKVKFIIAAPYTDLPGLKKIATAKIKLAAQNLYPGVSGAFTGEISGKMLKPLVDYVIVGHSERRRLMNEDDDLINQKVKSALDFQLKPIICFGETAEEKEQGLSKQVIQDQLAGCLADVSSEELKNIIFAYEPVWAISTTPGASGEGDNPENAQVMHRLVRHNLEQTYGKVAGDELTVIYGGSVKPKNAESFLSMPDIDGALIGGASLQIDSFFEIIEAANNLM